jgi:hypothetical protein
MTTPVHGRRPRPTPDGWGGRRALIYDLDVVCKVAKERMLEMRMEDEM